jgi:hypothetical protein
MGLSASEDGPGGPCETAVHPRYWMGSKMHAAVTENDIRALLDSPSSGDEAPTLAHIEDALTTGYARAMALEAEQSRLQRRIAEVVVALADDDAALPDPELKPLAQQLKATQRSLLRLRTLLDSLRTRAMAARAA